MSIKIGNELIEPGEKRYIKLKITKLLDGSVLTIPLHVVCGRKSGPLLGLFSTLHGAEYCNIRSIKTIIEEVKPSELRGSILAIPICNPLAFSKQERGTPWMPNTNLDVNYADLNRVFPGKRQSAVFGSSEEDDISLTELMAWTINENVLSKCNHVIDFHGHGGFGALKKMLWEKKNPLSEKIAVIFGLGMLHNTKSSDGKNALKTLTGYASSLGCSAISVELGGGLRGKNFEATCHQLGLTGIRNVMKYLEMIDGEPIVPEKQFLWTNAPHVRAKTAGYLLSNYAPEDVGIGKPSKQVNKGDVLGSLFDPYSFKELDSLISPVSGLLYYTRTNGPVEALMRSIYAIADFNGSKWLNSQDYF